MQTRSNHSVCFTAHQFENWPTGHFCLPFYRRVDGDYNVALIPGDSQAFLRRISIGNTTFSVLLPTRQMFASVLKSGEESVENSDQTFGGPLLSLDMFLSTGNNKTIQVGQKHMMLKALMYSSASKLYYFRRTHTHTCARKTSRDFLSLSDRFVGSPAGSATDRGGHGDVSIIYFLMVFRIFQKLPCKPPE